jgi:hypothetical protein
MERAKSEHYGESIPNCIVAAVSPQTKTLLINPILGINLYDALMQLCPTG